MVVSRNSRSLRNSWFSTMSSRLRLVAAIRRKLLACSCVSPTARKIRSCKTRRRDFWIESGISPTSSRKRVPLSASLTRPMRLSWAPVKAPFRCPKSVDSTRDSVSEAQSTKTNLPPARLLLSWMVLAKSSLPVPVSPVISRFESERAAWAMSLKQAFMRGLVPTTLLTLRLSPSDRFSFSSRYFRARPSVRVISLTLEGLRI